MHTVAVDNWAADWARRAGQVPNGQVAVGLLVDLVADPRQHLARTATFPVTAAAAALRVEPGLLRTALRNLADAGLLTLACHDAGGPGGEVAVVTLTSPPPPPAASRPARAAASSGPPPADGRATGTGTGTWATPEDAEAMGIVAARLKRAHPAADPATVDALVASAYEELRDAKVRTFIPILAERRAKALLTLPPPDALAAPGD
ncbi:three-helix bundle dimerization domain-containing protein [Kitasatospora sp. NPDC088346]|uniref:three-helix bundle dimerization domain-containing protein n=1 Tax=Kitasatospora sp. NPDC088346 TaxID=3364073 RepID=UPI00380587BD